MSQTYSRYQQRSAEGAGLMANWPLKLVIITLGLMVMAAWGCAQRLPRETHPNVERGISQTGIQKQRTHQRDYQINQYYNTRQYRGNRNQF